MSEVVSLGSVKHRLPLRDADMRLKTARYHAAMIFFIDTAILGKGLVHVSLAISACSGGGDLLHVSSEMALNP
jgi:hypothetical protein